MVAPDDEVGAAVVLAADRVPDRLARAAVAHGRGEGREQHAVLRVVAVQQRAVAVDAHRGRHVVALRLADQRVHEQAVDDLERRLGDVLVRAVDRVAGLEAGHRAPAALGDDPPGVDGIERQARGTTAPGGRRPARRRPGTGRAARRCARRRDAPRRSCRSSARPRAAGRTRRRPRRRARASSRAVLVGERHAVALRRRATASVTGSAHSVPLARRMSSTTRGVVVLAHEAAQRRQCAARPACRGRRPRAARARTVSSDSTPSGRSPTRVTSSPPWGAITGRRSSITRAPRLRCAPGPSLLEIAPARGRRSPRAPRSRVSMRAPGSTGGLVRVADARELLDLTGEGLGVQALHVAARALVDRRVRRGSSTNWPYSSTSSRAFWRVSS